MITWYDKAHTLNAIKIEGLTSSAKKVVKIMYKNCKYMKTELDNIVNVIFLIQVINQVINF